MFVDAQLPPYEKVRLEMLRPNLYSLLAASVMLMFGSTQAAAQYGPAPGYQPHQPLIQMPRSTYQAPIVDHYVESAPRLWDDSRPVEHFLSEVARRSWVRVEYLHWDTKPPGASSIGAPVTGIFSSTGQFEGFDNLNGGASVGTSVLPNNAGIGLDDGPGVRGTWGVHLNGGEAEVSFFGTRENSDTFSSGNIRNGSRDALTPAIGTPQSPNFIIPLLDNGAVSDVGSLNGIVIDDNLSLSMTTQLWGAEAALLTEAYLPGEGFKWQWLGGFRYINLDESYGVRGVFNAGGLAADRITIANSSSQNHMYGPEIGGRASLVHRWMTLSVTPRIAFALNDNTSTVSSDPLGTGVFTTATNSEVDFTTITQVSFKGEVNLSSNFSIYGGYDFMWMPRASRPHSNIRWDSTTGVGGAIDPVVGLHKRLQNYAVEGLSIGAVFRY